MAAGKHVTRFTRKTTRRLMVGNVPVGGDAPVSIQSMTTEPTKNPDACLTQIEALAAAGCQIVRVAVPEIKSALALPKIVANCPIPLIADIHFDYRLAISAVEAGVDGLRLNPGNIGGEKRVREVVAAVRERGIPIRIGVNGGSLPKDIKARLGLTPEALVESALSHVRILEKLGYDNIKISVKASSVPLTIASYRLLSEKVDYPLHLGVTEAGTEMMGTVKSSVGIGTLLSEGIGDTIRVSLTADPVREVFVARGILRSLDLRPGLELVSCPTCARRRIDVITLANEVEQALKPFEDADITVAVMGCEVNGPDEAREADWGVAGGAKDGVIFRRGEVVEHVVPDELAKRLIELIRKELEPGV